MKATWYCRNVVEPKRPYLTDAICRFVLLKAHKREGEFVHGEHRIRHWAHVPELEKCVRVVTLADGETVHNAFMDRDC